MKIKFRKFLEILVFGILLSGGIIYSQPGNTSDRSSDAVQKIEASAEDRFFWPYLLYIPEKLRQNPAPVPLFVVPNNTGQVSDSLEVHEVSARKTIRLVQPICDSLGIPLLVPVFPRPESQWKIYTHALDRDVFLTDSIPLKRLDLQLLKMIANARKRLFEQGISLREKILMAGYSASGMFVNRFTLLHPEKILAAAIGSPGGWPIAPVAEWQGTRLTYPVGIADLPEIAGHSVNISAFLKVKLFFFLGSEDDNDSVTFDDGYDETEREIIMRLFGPNLQDRWQASEEIYRTLPFEDCHFVLYPGVDHKVSPEMQRDMFIFLQKVLQNN